MLYSLQKYIDSPNAILFINTLGLLVFLMLYILIAQVVIIHCCFISLMTSDNEHLYRCLLAICFVKFSLKSFVHFKLDFQSIDVQNRTCFQIYIMDVAFQSEFFLFRYFKEQNFQFNKIQFIDFYSFH